MSARGKIQTTLLRTLEVADLENRSTGFCGSSLELRTVNLDKALAIEIFAEEVSDPVLKLEDGLVCLCLRAG